MDLVESDFNTQQLNQIIRGKHVLPLSTVHLPIPHTALLLIKVNRRRFVCACSNVDHMPGYTQVSSDYKFMHHILTNACQDHIQQICMHIHLPYIFSLTSHRFGLPTFRHLCYVCPYAGVEYEEVTLCR